MNRLIKFAALALLALASGPALALDYPTRTVRMVVPYPAGGTTDIMARLVASHLSEKLGQTFVVENKPGGGTNIGTQEVINAAPDGYTLLIPSPANAINATLYKQLPFDFIRDTVPVAGLARVPNVMEVNPEVPVKTVQEFIDYAKKNPGKINMASSGNGSSIHLSGELFKAMTGVTMQQVPYRGTPAVLPDLLGGRLNIFFGNISNVLPLVREGKLRAFAVTSRKRSPQIPELPTMEELGFPGYEATAWFGLMGPAGLPQPIVDRLHAETTKVMAQPDVRKKLESLGLQLVGNTPAQFLQIVKDELPMWGKVIKDAGIKAAQ